MKSNSFYEEQSKEPSIKDVCNFKGRYEGRRVQKESDISNSRLVDLGFLFIVETDFVNIFRLFIIKNSKLRPNKLCEIYIM